MTPTKILEAYKAITELIKCVFPYKVARNVTTLKRQLSEEFETILNTEKALAQKYNGTIQNNTYHFDTTEDVAQFRKEYDTFMNQSDDSMKLQHVDLSKYVDDIKISPSAIEALEGLVSFE